jgi:predicted CXXCH cytochrome family protein
LLAGATLKLTNHGIDQRCEQCHIGHLFHEANVVHARSCTACHQEHQGGGPMAAPGDLQCRKCHGDSQEMAASAEKGKVLPASAFARHPNAGWTLFETPRPANGLTAVFTAFATDHPEFRLIAERLRETNTLKFNHRRHLIETNDIPLLEGQRLDCTSCHRPGPGGAFFQKISYERHCRACHGLQFDEQNPALTLPHGRADHVRAFLRSLPTHYAALAQQNKASSPDVDDFVSKQMMRLREQFIDGTNLEREIFFTAFRKSPDGRAKFDGCATCHEVKLDSLAGPVITRPSMPDRWMIRARFDHSKHTSVSCTKCHDALRSADTADILMPSKATCVECHSPKGQAASNCSFCHRYHAPTATTKIAER